MTEKELNYNLEMFEKHNDKLFRLSCYYTKSEIISFCEQLEKNKGYDEVLLLENLSIPDFIVTTYYVAVNEKQRKIMKRKIEHLIEVLENNKAYYERVLRRLTEEILNE